MVSNLDLPSSQAIPSSIITSSESNVSSQCMEGENFQCNVTKTANESSHLIERENIKVTRLNIKFWLRSKSINFVNNCN